MQCDYQFANLLGTVYRHGNIEFTADGNTVICIVGNKISLYDLKNSKSYTLPVEARYNFHSFAISPRGDVLVTSSEGGEMHMVKMDSRQVMMSKKFNKTIKCIKYSPDGSYFSITKDNCVFVYTTPSSTYREYSLMNLKKVLKSAHDETTCMDWLHDSSAIVFGAEDMTVHVCAIKDYANLREVTVAGCTDKIIGVYFLLNSLHILVVTRDGQVSVFESSIEFDELITKKDVKEVIEKVKKSREEDDEPEFRVHLEEEDDNDLTYKKFKNKRTKDIKKELTHQMHYRRTLRMNVKKRLKDDTNVTLTACCFYKKLERLAVGFSSGEFSIMDLSDKGEPTQIMKIENKIPHPITSMVFNDTGDWLAIGIAKLGQLAVWEWQSETFILKQQGHFDNIRVVAQSPDGVNLATGGEDGKVKLWSMDSSFCYMTRTEHKAAVTGIAFTQSGKAVLSSSLDGTVRAFDLMRYRNFKTLTANKPAQFSCLAVDSNGELVTAGGQDTHEIFLWSLQTGRLLEVMGGHSGPVMSVQFSPIKCSSMMISTALDMSVKVWEGIEKTMQKETIQLLSDGLCVAFRPDGNQFAVATLDGHITLFDPSTCQQVGNIEGKNDLLAGRTDTDKITARRNQESGKFTTINYSANGSLLIAGGQGKAVCIYSLETLGLIKRYEITQNRSFDGMDEIVDRKKMAENGINLSLIEERDDDSSQALALPGVRRGEHSTRSFRPEVRVHDLSFANNGRRWVACTTEGLLIYSKDHSIWIFDPLDIDEDITPDSVRQTLARGEYSTAIMMAIKLNIDSITQNILEKIPVDEIPVIVNSLTSFYIPPLLNFLAKILSVTHHLEFYSVWCKCIMIQHDGMLRTRTNELAPVLTNLENSFASIGERLAKVANHASSTGEFFEIQNKIYLKRKSRLEKEQDDDDDFADEPMDTL